MKPFTAFDQAMMRRALGDKADWDLAAGDLIVEVTITVPEQLTEEQERMIREFADAGGMKY